MNEQKLKEIENWKQSNLENYRAKGGKVSQHEIDHIFDWLSSDDASSYRKRLKRLSVPDALKLAQKWTDKLNHTFIKKNEISCDLNGVEIVKTFDSNYYFVKLASQESFEREGALMGHCVSSYYDKNQSTIYSLRDKSNKPHCTIEILHEKHEISINQVKGRANLEVVQKYHQYIISFLNDLLWHNIYESDLKNFNCTNIGNILYPENQVPKNLDSLKTTIINQNYNFNNITINGDLHIEDINLSILADNVTVYGDLFIKNTHQLLRLCNNLTVYGDVELENCYNLKILAKDESYIMGSIVIEDCHNLLFKKLKANQSIEILD
jgi:hypothetical protein